MMEEMTREEAENHLKTVAKTAIDAGYDSAVVDAVAMAIEAMEHDPSTMLFDIYMAGVNMTEPYQGVWVRYRDIEQIVTKYMPRREKK